MPRGTALWIGKTCLVASYVGHIVLAYPMFLLASTGVPAYALIAQLVLVVLLALYAGPGPAMYCELFPTKVRYTALSIGYNIPVAIFSGFAPFIATWLIQATRYPRPFTSSPPVGDAGDHDLGQGDRFRAAAVSFGSQTGISSTASVEPAERAIDISDRDQKPNPHRIVVSTLGVDLGKTACRVMLWRGPESHGPEWLAAKGPGAPGLADPNGANLAEMAIMAVATPLLRKAGVSRIDTVGVGAAGAWSASEAAHHLAQRLAVRLRASNVAVASDAITSHAGALGGQPGIVLAVGTGAVAVVVGPNGTVHRIDGLGPWLGDEGGGAAIGRAGLRAALRASDRRGPATTLVAAASAQFGPLAALPARFAVDPNPAHLAATFAPAVIQAALANDPVAHGLIDDAATALIATIRAARDRLPANRPFPFALVGGLAETPSLTHSLRAALPTLALTPVMTPGSALDGACWLASTDTTLFDAHVQRAAHAETDTVDTLDQLATETVRPGLDDLDQRSPATIVALSLAAEQAAQGALAMAAPALGALADAVAARMARGGRLFYIGAGTPGRLAMLDAAELAPTYSAPPGQVIALLAGGPGAMIQAAEGAEDDASAAAAALEAHGLTAEDAVVGIAASGRTPFVVGGLIHARARGALTGAIVNNPGSPAAAAADIAVEILTGPEIVAGSTRMMAGTTQKIALNALSTACMVALGKTYGSRMVDVRASNAKLRRRALRTVCEVTACAEAEAAAALAAVGGRVKPALVMLLAGVDAATAERRLEAAGGRIRLAIKDHVARDVI